MRSVLPLLLSSLLSTTALISANAALAQTTPEVVDAADQTPVEEDVNTALANERLMTQAERSELQTLLKELGFYQGTIDASIGPGTRAAMSAWQEANGYEVTGVMTTSQRAEIVRVFNKVLEDLDVQVMRDDASGVQVAMPLTAVEFDRYDPPFVHFKSTGNIPEARALIISQQGDRNTLIGLYDIMQTLEIVPPLGERAIEGDGFTLQGENGKIVSYTKATLLNGEIKGFTLIWPAGDEDRRRRLVGEMESKFERVAGVLDPATGADNEQRVDLLAGLEIRRPTLSRSGFYVDGQGTVVTTLEAVKGCGRVTIDEDYGATIVATDENLGVAVLRPAEPLAPSSIAKFQQVAPRLNSEVAVAGFSYGGVLGAPTMTFGKLEDVRGLNGEEELERLALATLEGDAGGPVVDGYGAVVGMLLPKGDEGRTLPEGVNFAADAGALSALLQQAGIAPTPASSSERVAPETLSKQAAGMTVLVSCWE